MSHHDSARYRGVIAPVPLTVDRPLWSVMIPTYHCADFLRETLDSVLRQDPGREHMQIEVVDDCSTRDDPEAVVEAVGKGRVDFYRQPRNVGHVANFNTCLQRSRGYLVHLLHGDDAVLDDFYSIMQRPFSRHPEIGAAFCRYIAMNERGDRVRISDPLQKESAIIDGWLEMIATGQRLQPPAFVARREVYERLGGFDQRIRAYGEDWEMSVRIAAHYPVWHEAELLALYRVGQTSLSRRSLRTGENMQDLARIVEINREVLPSDRADAISREASKSHALAAIRRGRRMIGMGDPGGMRAQLREALRTSREPLVLAHALRLVAIWGARAGQRKARSARQTAMRKDTR